MRDQGGEFGLDFMAGEERVSVMIDDCSAFLQIEL